MNALSVKRTKTPLTDLDIKKIINMHIANPNMQQKEIAAKVGKAPCIVCTILKGYKNRDTKIMSRYSSMWSPVTLVVDPTFKHTKIIKNNKPVEKKARPKKVGGRILPGRHAIITHKLTGAYKEIDRKELEILKSAKTSHDFVSGYFKQFGFDTKTSTMLNEVWKRKEDILKYEDDKEKHSIEMPVKKITEPMKTKDRESMVDEDRMLVDIFNTVTAMNNQLQDIIKALKIQTASV
jgi:hypothetical protein